jgi:hypothetical protein
MREIRHSANGASLDRQEGNGFAGSRSGRKMPLFDTVRRSAISAAKNQPNFRLPMAPARYQVLVTMIPIVRPWSLLVISNAEGLTPPVPMRY